MSVSMNREGWLTELAKMVHPIFKGFTIPAYRVTCGWPSKFPLGARKRRIGECHGAKSSKGGVYELFISPVLDKPIEVAGVVCHELTHVAAGVEAGHERGFVKVARHIGLTKGKPTQAMPGPLLEEKLEKLISTLGQYPHQALSPIMQVKETELKDLTVKCPGCGCRARMSIKWLEEAGVPTCGCGTPMQLKDV
jgi:hypothetical protein